MIALRMPHRATQLHNKKGMNAIDIAWMLFRKEKTGDTAPGPVPVIPCASAVCIALDRLPLFQRVSAASREISSKPGPETGMSMSKTSATTLVQP